MIKSRTVLKIERMTRQLEISFKKRQSQCFQDSSHHLLDFVVKKTQTIKAPS